MALPHQINSAPWAHASWWLMPTENSFQVGRSPGFGAADSLREALSRLSSGNVIQMCFPGVQLNGDKVGQTHECAHIQTHARPITE